MDRLKNVFIMDNKLEIFAAGTFKKSGFIWIWWTMKQFVLQFKCVFFTQVQMCTFHTS